LTFLANGNKLLPLELLELCDGIFINGVDKQEDFETFLRTLRNGESRVLARVSPVR